MCTTTTPPLDRFKESLRAALALEPTPLNFTESGIQSALASLDAATVAARLHLLTGHPLDYTDGPINGFVCDAGRTAYAATTDERHKNLERASAESDALYFAGLALGLLLAERV